MALADRQLTPALGSMSTLRLQLRLVSQALGLRSAIVGVRHWVSIATISFVLIKRGQVCVVELPHDPPSVVADFWLDGRHTATAVLRLPRKAEDMIWKVAETDEARLRAAFHHLGGIHV